MSKFLALLELAVARSMLGLIRFYRLAISPWLGPRCRFLPSCSEYAAQAIRLHGARCGTKLALVRLLRCHPWGGHGLDEVPPSLGRSACACSPLLERPRRFR